MLSIAEAEVEEGIRISEEGIHTSFGKYLASRCQIVSTYSFGFRLGMVSIAHSEPWQRVESRESERAGVEF